MTKFNFHTLLVSLNKRLIGPLILPPSFEQLYQVIIYDIIWNFYNLPKELYLTIIAIFFRMKPQVKIRYPNFIFYVKTREFLESVDP